MPDDVAGGRVDGRGAGVARQCGRRPEPMDRWTEPTRAMILPAVSVAIPHSSVNELPESTTAALMSLAALAIR